MQKWEQPRVVKLDSLPDVLGKCESGSTAGVSTCTGGQIVTQGNGCKSGGTP